jgi:hypothetical protein
MNLMPIAIVLVAAAALVGIARTWRSRGAHRGMRIALQLAAAVLLALALFPPRIDERFAADTLIVLTPGATAGQIAAAGSGSARVALPRVEAARDVERAPDLGTALRRHAGAARLRIVGGGLPPRDLDAARGHAVTFDAAPLPRGVVELSAPSNVRTGSAFSIGGRVEGDAGGRVELADPSGAVISRSALDENGAFDLTADARTAGRFVFGMRVYDHAGAEVEALAQPVVVEDGDAMRLLVLAGAPDPELKYLRRWAEDAGVELTSRIGLSDGILMQDGRAALTAEALAKTDLVLVDERAWKELDAGAKSRLADAAREGLGLFLRVTGPVPDEVAADWRALGFRVRAADVPLAVSLRASDVVPDPAAVLTRRAMIVDADGATPLLRAADGSALALWRGDGEGRIAIWWLADTYRMALAGDAAAFGTLWSRALATVARAHGAPVPEVPDDARVDRRSVLCGLADGAFVEAPDATRVPLTIESAGDGRRCAAYWPSRAGWHTLVAAGSRRAFHVRERGEGIALERAQTADATRALAGFHADPVTSTRAVPAPRWPFFLAWLAAAALLWWLERTRARSVAV